MSSSRNEDLVIGKDGALNFEGRAWSAGELIEQASVFEKEELILVILSRNAAHNLVGLDYELDELFRVGPPDGCFFHYLSRDVESRPAVVCCQLAGTAYDWNYGINPKNGELTSLSRAY